jgi:hypothetical protein
LYNPLKDKKNIIIQEDMPTAQYKEARVCECGYSTITISNWSTHKKRCKSVTTGDKERIASLERQLVAKDEQLAAKDRQIEQLIKRPRTVTNNTTNNRFVVETNVNLFGKETIEHITSDEIQALLADPVNAVPQFIKLKHKRAPGGVNQNVRIPSQKRAIYQVVVQGEGDGKEWESKAKGEILEQLYDDNSGHLEAEADEGTRVGSQFLEHQDLVRSSANGEDGGRRYKEQLDKIHNVMV